VSSEEVLVDSASASQAARLDFNYLAGLALAGDFLFNFPKWYLVLFQLLTSFKNRVERFAIGLPRGFAKTTFLKILCLWYILFSHKRFVLVLCASETKAIGILSDVEDMLSSPNIRRLFGHWDANVEENNKTIKVFYFRGRSIVLWAAGAGTSVRGINRKNQRPDVMIMDDIQDKEDAQNKDLADALLVWMLGTLMKARSPFGCTFIFVGNMYPQNSILEKLKNNSQWTSLVVGGILADGTSLWEELKPIDELVAEYQSDTEMGHPEVFISEVLNSTDIALSSGIDISKIPFLPEYFKELMDEDPNAGEASFILIDPSAAKKASDDCTINHFEVLDGKPVFDELMAGVFTPTQTIKLSIDLAIRRNTRLICVEDVAYQSTLLHHFEQYCEREGITGFYFEPVSPRGQAKNNRIKRGAVKVLAGEVLLHPSVRSLVVSQYVDWNPLKTNNKDDIIDPIGYVEEVLQNYGPLAQRAIFEIRDVSVKAAHTSDLALPF
jgi:hypothetical protein